MGQRVIIDLGAVLPQRLHEVRNLPRIPVQNRVGHEAEAAGLVHHFFVIAGRKFALIGKEDAPGEAVAILAFVKLELYGSAQLRLRQIAQDEEAAARESRQQERKRERARKDGPTSETW